MTSVPFHRHLLLAQDTSEHFPKGATANPVALGEGFGRRAQLVVRELLCN
jgi:hypothetical protein